MLTAYFVTLLLSDLSLASDPVQSNWTGFQNGGRLQAADLRLPTQWSATENIAWKSPITGYGQSTPIADGDQVMVTSVSGMRKEHFHFTAFSVHDGKELWQRNFDNPTLVENNAYTSRAAPSPVLDPSGYFAFCEGGLVVALSREGKLRWQRDLVAEYGAIEARHGLASSLEQNDEYIFVWVERSKDPYLIAIDKKSGNTAWKVSGLGATTWCTPRLIMVKGTKHLVCSASGLLIGLDPSSGKRLWDFGDIANNTSCTPIPIGDGTFFIGASEGRGETATSKSLGSNGVIKVEPAGAESFDVKFVWQTKKATCSFGSPVIAGDRVFVVNKAGVVHQLAADTGKELSVERTKAGSIWATPIVCGTNVYLFGQKGTTSVLSTETGKSFADLTLWAHANGAGDSPDSDQTIYGVAAINSCLILRTGNTLYAIKSLAGR